MRPEAEWFLEAFWLLSTCRPSGMGPGGIPLADIEAYCRLANVYDRPQLVRMISYLDASYLRWAGEKSDPKNKSK